MEEVCFLDSISSNSNRIAIRETSINSWRMNNAEPDYFHMNSLLALLGYKDRAFTFSEFLKAAVSQEDSDNIRQSISDLEKNRCDDVMIKYNAVSDSGDWNKIRSIIKVQERNESGRIECMASQHSNVTSLEKMNRIFEKRKGKYLFVQTIFEEVPIGIALINSEFKFKIVNPFLCKLLDYSHNELMKLSFDKIISKNFFEPINTEIGKILEGKLNTFNREIKLLNNFAEEIWVNIYFTTPDDFKEKPDCLIMTCENITLRKKAEIDLLKSEKKFKSLFEQSNDVIFITDLDGKILEINRKASEQSGFSREELLKMELKNFSNPENKEKVEDYLKNIKKSESSRYESSYRNKYNNYFEIEINSNLIYLENSKAYLHISRDITERKKMQQSIINAIMMTEEKERQRFAKDLHDGLGPLLSAAKLYIKSIELAKDQAKQLDAIGKAMGIVDESVSAIKEIARNLSPHILRDFGLVTALENQFNKLNAEKDVKLQINSNFRERIQEDMEITLFRIFEELFNNTLKYADASNVLINLIQNDKMLKISYSDNGKGFDLEKVANKRKGNGIPNIISRVESIRGRINMESKPDNGMQVRIEIDT